MEKEPADPETDRWTYVCRYDELTPGRGVAALVDGEQVAVFRTAGGLYALENRDPQSGAYVISRGIVGSRGRIPTVASPMHKDVFDLRTGACLDTPRYALATHLVFHHRGLVFCALD